MEREREGGERKGRREAGREGKEERERGLVALGSQLAADEDDRLVRAPHPLRHLHTHTHTQHTTHTLNITLRTRMFSWGGGQILGRWG
eukprot:2755875-Rhodomonas_salina.1